MAFDAESFGDLLEFGEDLAFQIRPLDRAQIHLHAPSLSSFWSCFQSERNLSSPASVRGCFTSFEKTSNGIVATSAPSRAASTTCIGWRRDAARTRVSYPWTS